MSRIFRVKIHYATPAIMQSGIPSHCSAPPLQTSFRPPLLSRDAEAVLRPRTPLRPMKREQQDAASVEFVLDEATKVKVEVKEVEEVEVVQDPRQLCVRLAAVHIAPAVDQPRGRGRPKRPQSRPRVDPRHDTSAPPERAEAAKARAKMAPRK